MHLTIQLHHDGKWQDAATIAVPSPERGRQGPMRLGYLQEHALEWMFRDDEHACSMRLPVELMLNHSNSAWFAFIDDIMPAGAARRYWLQALGLVDKPSGLQDWELLRRGTIAPVGNMRIKEAVPTLPVGSNLPQRRFTIAEVVERQGNFLEYAQQLGALSGGATGAGGEAPKLLLRCTADHHVWIDPFQDDDVCDDRHYLVKFPRGQRSAIDCDILRAEFHYYQELAALGIDTIATAGMQLHEGSRYPSLWLPRFDVEWQQGRLLRHGLESIYAVLGKAPGSHLNHFTTLRLLVAMLGRQWRVSENGEHFDQQRFISSWLQRDLLNIIFGNSDNHGRNCALLKKPSGIWLAPVYDFAPMKADPEGIIRTSQWGAPFEEGGEYRWRSITTELADIADSERLWLDLQGLASQLIGLPQRLAERGVPEQILDFPAIGLAATEAKLQRWGLL